MLLMNPLLVSDLIQPGYVVGLLVILITSQLLYAFFPYHRRNYLLSLLTTTVAVILGEAWEAAGLPALQAGDANLLPALLFAILMQPLTDRLTALLRSAP
jgi:hypothetical protein